MLGWHAPRIRRAMIAAVVGFVAFLALVPFVAWEVAALTGWDVAAALFLVATWELIVHADAPMTRRLATVEDETRSTAAVVILSSTVASLLAVAFTLAAADEQRGWKQTAYVFDAVVTVVLSWTVLNTLYTLRYADAHFKYQHGRGVEIGGDDTGEDPPDYRDFAYLAFTIGMCYQVSDQTIRSRHMRRTVLVHAVLAYAFGVIIIASTINLLGNLIG
jgi:uncharacterized membrane protein